MSSFATAEWFAGKDFTADWTSHNFPVWETILADLRDSEVAVLEIGSWEGRSAIFFLRYLPLARLTCIDAFTGNPERHAGDVEYLQACREVERRFDANLREFVGRVEKRKARSVPALDALAVEGRSYDVIYIDGSHTTDDVLIDSLLSWRLLKHGGLLMWDDYGKPGVDQPKPAIDAFLALKREQVSELHRGYQIIVQRRHSPN